MQHKILEPSDLLNKYGELIQKGYATCPILTYKRSDVARKLRLKEWDYYLISNDQYITVLLVAKTSSIVLINASIIDLQSKMETSKNIIRLISNKKLSLPESSEKGDIQYQDKQVNISFLHRGNDRVLHLFIKNFTVSSSFEADFLLTEEPHDSMVIATPFTECDQDFYYNRKIIGMSASGKVKIYNQSISFDSDYSYALLDWGRGVWPYKTSWYWSAGQGMISGSLFAFNLGYGFGDTSAATENMVFYNGIANKLKDITFHIPTNDKKEYDYMSPWTVTSSDRRFEMIFTPVFDRTAFLSAIVLSTDQHQVFGHFTGTAILDDKSVIYLKDFPGFVEIIKNRW
jgi:hypothetical protein